MNADEFVDKFLDWAINTPPCLVDGIAYNKFLDLIEEAKSTKS